MLKQELGSQARPPALAHASPAQAEASGEFITDDPKILSPLLANLEQAMTEALCENVTVRLNSIENLDLQAIVDKHGQVVRGNLSAPAHRENGAVIFPSSLLHMLAITILGDSTNDPNFECESPTPVQRAFIEILMEKIAFALGEWAFRWGLPENKITTTDFLRTGASHEHQARVSLTLCLEVSVGTVTGELAICLPEAIEKAFLSERSIYETPDESARSPDWNAQWRKRLGQAPLRMDVVLDELTIQLFELGRMSIGQILPIKRADFRTVILGIGNISIYECELETDGRRYALKIVNMAEPDRVLQVIPNAMDVLTTVNSIERLDIVNQEAQQDEKTENKQQANEGLTGNREAVLGIPINVQVVLGSTYLTVSDLLGMEKGRVLELNQCVGDPVEIVVNGRPIARGEIVIVDETRSRYGVCLQTILGTQPKSLPQ